ncbi:hypothetical protein EPO34_02370 [Patescibacteria group bacterium]|nr:MAG: hypothetical protein EPO34_02370 [Patescibacteria group bacterium]
MLTLLIFLAVLAVLVLAHEAGHFIMAKKAGMTVEEFGFGFPPRLWSWKKGDTAYSINLIPLGGFVKIKGESGGDRDHPGSFSSKRGAWRFAVLAAGVAMNLVLAAGLITTGFALGLPSVVDESMPASAKVRDVELRVMTVAKGSPAEHGGVRSGDVLVSVDGEPFLTAEAARAYIGAHGDQGVLLVLGRDDGTFFNVSLTSEDLAAAPGIHGVGVGLVKTGLVSYPLPQAFVQGVLATGTYTKEVVLSFAGLVKGLFTGTGAGADLSGPVGIAVLTGQAAQLGFTYLLQFTALLSINLAVVNVLPLPALDGGRIFLLIMEKARGQSMRARSEALIHSIGFVALMALVLVVTYQDIVKYGAGMLKAISH